MENIDFLLSRIKIKGLFGYKDIDWELFQDVNILGGINGSGKSTILKCVYSILQNKFLEDYLADLITAAEIHFTNKTIVYWSKEDTTDATFEPQKNIEYKRSLSDKNEAFFLQSVKVLKDNKLIRFDDIKDSIKSVYTSTFENKIVNNEILNNLEEKDLKTNLDIILYNQIVKRNAIIVDYIEKNAQKGVTEEINRKFQKDILDKLTEELKEKFGKDANFTDENSDKIISIVENKKSNFQIFMQKLLENVLNQEKAKVSKSVELKFDIHSCLNTFFETTGKSALKKNSQLQFIQNEKIISCYNLSTGEKQLIIVLLMIFNTMDERCILLMDEPDLGMHITWKEKFITTLRKINPNAQIILTTHAPSMVRGWVDNVKEIKQITVN